MINTRGIVYTFYSFKGGVGRSMALANVAALLSKAGKRVLVVDWDLEAPGLEKYFAASLSGTREASLGVVDLICSYARKESVDWRSRLLYATPFGEGKQISILTAGRDDDNYVSNLQSINWENLFLERKLGNYLEALREEWVASFDFVLIDSRTGITDIGGICTIHLPDILVLFFTSNEQSVDGIKDIIKRVWKQYKTLPLDRSKLLAVPVPSRFETITENDLSVKWKGIFANTFFELYQDWLPDKMRPSDIVEKLFIPYVPYWSFGEGLPVVEEGTGVPGSLGSAYDLLARLLNNRLEWQESVSGGIKLANESSPKLVDESMEYFFHQLPSKTADAVIRLLMRFIYFDPILQENDSLKRLNASTFEERDFSTLEELLKANILFRTVNTSNGSEIFEISKKEIIKYWKRLDHRILEDRQFLLWRQDINQKAHQWIDGGRYRDDLLTGRQTGKAKTMLASRKKDLIDLEIDFIRESNLNEQRLRLNKFVPYALGLIAVILVAWYTNKQNEEQNYTQTLSARRDSIFLMQTQNTLKVQEQINHRLQLQTDSLTKLLYIEMRQKKSK